MLKRLCAGLVLSSVASVAWSVDQIASVDELLHRASKALQETNYKGRLTYEFGSTLETLEVVHVVKDGIEYERIHHLSGVQREFLRSGRESDCITVGAALLRGGLISTGRDAVSLAQNYHFYIRGDDRIAGRAASVVQVVPKDELRYGMTLAVDNASGLPLMSLTTTPKSTLERFQFVHLDVDIDILEEDLAPVIASHHQLDGESIHCGEAPQTEPNWHATWVPAGFVLSQSSQSEEHGEVLTYTDGIASFSVFVSTIEQEDKVKTGVARRGATVALMSVTSHNDHPTSVILVGEVPPQTAQRVAASVRPI